MVQVMVFVLALFWVLVNPYSIKSQTIDEILEKIQTFYQKIQTIQADFTQEVYFPGKDKEVSSGKFYIKKPGKFRWEYHTPQKFQIISKGDLIYFYYPKEKQAFAYPSGKTLGSNLALGFMTGRGNLKIDTKVESFRVMESNFWEINFLPVPKDPKVQKITLVVNPDSGEVREFIVINHSGERVRILIKNIRYNTRLKDSLFEFSPPKDVKIINAFET